MPDSNAAMQVEKYADEKLKEQDSMGGIIECVVTGMMAGVGDPVFEKLDANLANGSCLPFIDISISSPDLLTVS